jgi:hypothetical protein
MNNIQKRFLLFLFGCIPTRLAFMYFAKICSLQYLPILGYVALILAFGFLYLFLTGSRTTGAETFGEKIWWNNLRPIHALLYILFAYNAINKVRNAWLYLLYDIIIGLVSFLFFHYINNDFEKLNLKL